MDLSDEDEKSKAIIKRLEREIEMNTFQSLTTTIEDPKEFDEKLAREVEKEFYKRVEDSYDYYKRRDMILNITDRLRNKVKAKVQEELSTKSPLLDKYKSVSWKAFKVSGVEEKLDEPYMGEKDHYSRVFTDQENFENQQSEEEYEDEYEQFENLDSEYSYGISGDGEERTERIRDIRQKKGRGMMISLYEHNEESRIPKLIRAMQLGMKVALVSDAGTPTISDPGYKLINECYKRGILIESLPGPSAVLVAAAASGLAGERFLFQGYLSKTQSVRVNTLKYLKSTKCAIILFENPFRLQKTVYDISKVYGDDVQLYIGVELTKLHENNLRGTAKDLLEFIEDQEFNIGLKVLNSSNPNYQTPQTPTKGEVTVVIEGKTIDEDEYSNLR